MLTEKDMAELNEMTTDQLKGVIRIMSYQIGAKLLIGDRSRSVAVSDAAKEIIQKRAA